MYLLHYAILSFLFVKTNVNDNSNLILPNHKIQKGIMLSIILFPCYLASLSPGNYKSYFFVLFSGAEPKNDSLIIQSFYNDKENELKKKIDELNDSIEKYRKLVNSKPTTIDGYVKLATALAAVGHTEEALSSYEKALKIQPVRIQL